MIEDVLGIDAKALGAESCEGAVLPFKIDIADAGEACGLSGLEGVDLGYDACCVEHEDIAVTCAVGLALRFTDVAQVDGVAVTEDTPIDVASKHEGVTRLEGHGLAALRGGEAVEVVPIGEFGLCGELIFLRCYIIGVASHEEIGDSISSFEHGVQQSLT